MHLMFGIVFCTGPNALIQNHSVIHSTLPRTGTGDPGAGDS